MLVAIEGIDGAGKHTQVQALARVARAAGLSVATLSFPRYGRSFFASAVSELLSGGYGTANDPRLVGLLFAGDRLESRGELEQARRHHDLVLVDRYVASNVAYQAARVPPDERPAVVGFLEHVEHHVYGLPCCDLTLLLDLPVPLAVARLAHRAASGGRPCSDRYEADHALLDTCRSIYRDLAATRPSWVEIPLVERDAPLDPNDVTAKAWSLLHTALTRGGARRAEQG